MTAEKYLVNPYLIGERILEVKLLVFIYLGLKYLLCFLGMLIHIESITEFGVYKALSE